ncbi:hypothetical protein BDV98DRAFT_593484 [Pterulicium gracile]|uniref:Uncharacterized protein n=1 Tax=Pterulicium gracile TaxID=1884261 RepID=A0A5C3QIE1_9AGAR|nr:hypothetical protein BDV98DRAFT_593484 [Pterula gracilis]
MARIFSLVAVAALFFGAVQAQIPCSPGRYQCINNKNGAHVGVCEAGGQAWALIQKCSGRCVTASNGTPYCA